MHVCVCQATKKACACMRACKPGCFENGRQLLALALWGFNPHHNYCMVSLAYMHVGSALTKWPFSSCQCKQDHIYLYGHTLHHPLHGQEMSQGQPQLLRSERAHSTSPGAAICWLIIARQQEAFGQMQCLDTTMAAGFSN